MKRGSRVPAKQAISTSRPHHPNTLRLQQPAHLTCKANRGIAFAPRNKAFINWLSITDDFVITNIRRREMRRLVWVCALSWSAACLREQWCVDHKLSLNFEEHNSLISELLAYYGTMQTHACLLAFSLSFPALSLFLSSLCFVSFISNSAIILQKYCII